MTASPLSLALEALRRAEAFIEMIAREARADDDLWAYDRAGYVLDDIRPVLQMPTACDGIHAPDDPQRLP